MAKFDFELFCKQGDKYRDTDTTAWIGNHVSISVSVSFNLTNQTIFLCNSIHRALIESFVDAIDGLATQRKAQMELKVLEIGTSVKSKLIQIFSTLGQRRCRKEPVLEFKDKCIEEEEQDLSLQFLKTQKNQCFDLQDHLERYCNVPPVFGFNNAKNDIKLIKSYWLIVFVNERKIEPIVIRKSNQFVSFKFGDVQLVDILICLGAATRLKYFLKAYKASETEKFFSIRIVQWSREAQKH